MFNIFDKPPTKWNGMDFAEYNMLTNSNYNTAQRKLKPDAVDAAASQP